MPMVRDSFRDRMSDISLKWFHVCNAGHHPDELSSLDSFLGKKIDAWLKIQLFYSDKQH